MERRTRLRVPVDVPIYVTVCLESGETHLAILVDCGRGGVQLAFSPTEGPQTWLGQSLMIINLPAGLGADADGCPGVVTWISNQRCGVRFEQVLFLTDEDLIMVASSL